MEEYIDLNFAKLDLQREKRTGFKEVVFCQSKSDVHLVEIYKTLFEKNNEVFGTRATLQQAKLIEEKMNFAFVEYDEVSKILIARKKDFLPTKKIGNVAVCSAGTSDICVAEEASKTAEYFGCNVNRFYDIGVAGLQRLLDNIESIREANAIVTVAGMEGALATVLGGLVKVPIICVPTSVGYGANLGGIATLLSMINSCANGVSVVNIDNGYGAGYIATQINRLAEGVK